MDPNASENLTLSVIVPAYNEENSIAEILETVANVPPIKEIIVVNDASSDKTKSILVDFEARIKSGHKPPFLSKLHVVNKEINEGKGSAIRTGLTLVTGDIVLIQDADLELNPHEYSKLLEPFHSKYKADVVFGSRFRVEGIIRAHRLWHFLGNKALTWFSNIFTGLYITDMETCYKVFKREVITSFKIESNRFGIDPELTAKAAKIVKKKRLNFYEVPVSYQPRTYSEGKKIKIKDGFIAIFSIIYFNLFSK